MEDLVFPKDNENEFIRIAEKLGFKRLCLTYPEPRDVSLLQQSTNVELSTAISCRAQDIRKYKGKQLTLLDATVNHDILRGILEKTPPDILYNIEYDRRKDFIHHRASGLNHILAAIAAKKNVTIGMSFSKLLSTSHQERAIHIGRIKQNMLFARKFGFNTLIASFADNPLKMRSARDMRSFLSVSLNLPDNAQKHMPWRKPL